MKLKEMLVDTGVDCPGEMEDWEFSGVHYDSRQIERGDLFVCLAGEHVDGHVFALDAYLRGALAVLAEEEIQCPVPVLWTSDSRRALSRISANFYGRPSESLTVFGVTGTNGKTTVSYMLKSALETGGRSCGLVGTTGYQLGDKKYEATHTTPESRELQKLFYEMKERGMACCAMEVSSHALALCRADDIAFDHVIFTNLTRDHMDFHKDVEEYYQAKKKLFLLGQKTGMINIDDPAGSRLYEELKRERTDGFQVFSFSLKERKADFYGEVQGSTEKGSRMALFQDGAALGELTTHIPGLFMAYNALAASGSALSAGIPFRDIGEGLSALKGVPGRFQVVENQKGYLVIVDYAHTPDALENVLSAAAEITRGKLICVFGCGGDRDREKRPMMGRIAGTFSDYCIVTSDNPRTEPQEGISHDIEEGLYETDCNYEIIEDRREAIRRALAMYQRGDVILIAGKGHETYQIIGSSRLHFDDGETVRQLMETI